MHRSIRATVGLDFKCGSNPIEQPASVCCFKRFWKGRLREGSTGRGVVFMVASFSVTVSKGESLIIVLGMDIDHLQ